MEELSDYIYIILGIIIFIVSIIRKSTKKQTPPKPAASEEVPETDFPEDLIEKVTSTDKITADDIPFRFQQQEKLEITNEETDSRELFRPEEEGIPAVSVTGDIEDVRKDDEPGKEKRSLKKRFSLKDAIIYSEIINRKY